MKKLLSNLRSASKPKTRRRQRSIAALPAEALEDRVLLSNVSVSLRNGDLRITGDDNDNEVKVTQNTNAIVVEGLSGTTINGSNLLIIATSEVPDDVRVSFAAGGENMLILNQMIVGDDVNIKGGREADTIYFGRGTVADDINIRTGNGPDNIYVTAMDVEDLLSINTGSGRDKIVVGGTAAAAGALKVNAGQGSDEIFLTKLNVQGDTNLIAGAGNDDVFSSSFQTGDDLRASLGNGNDEFFAHTTLIADDARLQGGGGTDAVQPDNTIVEGTVTTSSIEQTTVLDGLSRASDLLARVMGLFPPL